jgi:xylulokinase
MVCNSTGISQAHLLRAAQEGIVFAFAYGMEIMQAMGINTALIRAGHANMFLSPLFRESLSTLTGSGIELYDTDGSVGAARGAGIGAGIYSTPQEAFGKLKRITRIDPNKAEQPAYLEAYSRWKQYI